MIVRTIHLIVPSAIQHGLTNGTLVRNAAGVIRATATHPSRTSGSIVAHLREINRPAQSAGGEAALIGVAGIALQAATLAYLDARLDTIDAALTGLNQTAQDILRCVHESKDLLYLQFTTPAAEALELLQRYSVARRPRQLEEAHSQFIRAGAGLRQLFELHDAERFLENVQQSERLFQAGAVCAAGELRCLALLDAPAEERASVLSRYAELWRRVQQKLADAPGTAHRVPTVAMLRSSGRHSPDQTRKTWVAVAGELAAAFAAESDFLNAVATLPRTELTELQGAVSQGAPVSLCMLVAA